MSDLNPFGKKKVPAKFEWVDGEFSAYLKAQSKILAARMGSERLGTKAASKVLFEEYIKPNNINLGDTIRPLKSKKKRWGFR